MNRNKFLRILGLGWFASLVPVKANEILIPPVPEKQSQNSITLFTSVVGVPSNEKEKAGDVRSQLIELNGPDDMSLLLRYFSLAVGVIAKIRENNGEGDITENIIKLEKKFCKVLNERVQKYGK